MIWLPASICCKWTRAARKQLYASLETSALSGLFFAVANVVSRDLWVDVIGFIVVHKTNKEETVLKVDGKSATAAILQPLAASFPSICIRVATGYNHSRT